MLKQLFRELKESYNTRYKEKINLINQHQNKMYRFFKKLWLVIIFSWIWLFKEFGNLKTIIVFLIIACVMSATVWIPLIIAFVFGFQSNVGVYCMSLTIGSLIFWNLPGTPFIIICLTITLILNRTILKNIGKKHKVSHH